MKLTVIESLYKVKKQQLGCGTKANPVTRQSIIFLSYFHTEYIIFDSLGVKSSKLVKTSTSPKHSRSVKKYLSELCFITLPDSEIDSSTVPC
jgi:hypothetical protein